MAQQVFYTLGQRASAAQGQPGTQEGARAALLDWWRQRLPASAVPSIDNGSGLSRTQRISAQAIADLLVRMAGSAVAADLLASLPVAGVDATMRQRLQASAGRAHLKTGSLRDVVAAAGYVLGRSGQRWVLVVLIQHEQAQAARPALEALVQWAIQDEGAGVLRSSPPRAPP